MKMRGELLGVHGGDLGGVEPAAEALLQHGGAVNAHSIGTCWSSSIAVMSARGLTTAGRLLRRR